MKLLIVYGSRFGATLSVAEEIAKVVEEKGFQARMREFSISFTELLPSS